MRTTILSLALVACADEPPGPTLRTVAGVGGVLMASGDGLPARETGLYMPTAITFSPDTGRLVIDDFNNFRLRELRPDGILETIAGVGAHDWAEPGPAVESPLENPIDLGWTADGALLVAEIHTGRVLHIADGELSILAGGAGYGTGHQGDGGPALAGQLGQLRGVTAGDDGTVYVSDTDNYCIRAITPDGMLRHVAGTDEPGYRDGPVDEAQFFLAERIRWFEGRLWVADAQNHVVRRIDLESGIVETVAGTGEEGFSGDGGPATEAQLANPTSMLPEADGGFWIADSENHRIRYVDPDGVIRTVVGDGKDRFAGDGGPPELGSLKHPADLARDDDGALYIADMLNGAIRKVTLADRLTRGGP